MTISVTLDCADCGEPRPFNVHEDQAAAARDGYLAIVCRECSHRHSAERVERKVRDALPPGLRDHQLGDLDPVGREAVLEAAHRWAAGELPGIALLGDVGVGKTTIAAAAVRDYCAQHVEGPTPVWLSTAALAALARDFGSPERDRTIDQLTGRSGPLCVDDLDKARPSPYAAEQLYLAIDLCITHARPLATTSNLTPGELAERWPDPYGRAIASRLAGYCAMHRLTGADLRLTGGHA